MKAVGLPYFRSLNAGLIIGNQLARVLTSPMLDDQGMVRAYNACRRPDKMWEFTAAQMKDTAFNFYRSFVKASAVMPWDIRWSADEAHDFQTKHHAAFMPDLTDSPSP